MLVEDRIKLLPKALTENNRRMYPALRSIGYSENYAKQPSKIRATKAYKKVMEPILKRLEKQRDKIVKALEEKDFSQEEFKDLTKALSLFNKDVQLLGGKATDITKFVIIEGDERDNEDKPMDSSQEPKDIS